MHSLTAIKIKMKVFSENEKIFKGSQRTHPSWGINVELLVIHVWNMREKWIHLKGRWKCNYGYDGKRKRESGQDRVMEKVKRLKIHDMHTVCKYQ